MRSKKNQENQTEIIQEKNIFIHKVLSYLNSFITFDFLNLN